MVFVWTRSRNSLQSVHLFPVRFKDDEEPNVTQLRLQHLTKHQSHNSRTLSGILTSRISVHIKHAAPTNSRNDEMSHDKDFCTLQSSYSTTQEHYRECLLRESQYPQNIDTQCASETMKNQTSHDPGSGTPKSTHHGAQSHDLESTLPVAAVPAKASRQHIASNTVNWFLVHNLNKLGYMCDNSHLPGGELPRIDKQCQTFPLTIRFAKLS